MEFLWIFAIVTTEMCPMDKKRMKLFIICLLILTMAGLGSCVSSHKTITYPKRKHRCNCPHFTLTEPVGNQMCNLTVYEEQ